MDGRADRPHDDGCDEVARNGGRRLDAEQQDEHRCHERAATRARDPHEEADYRAAEDDVRIHGLVR